MRMTSGLLGGFACAAAVAALAVGSSAVLAGKDSDRSPVNGRKVFLKANCYVCHGGRAGGGMCPNLRETRPDDKNVVRRGTPSGMPAFENILTDQEIEDVMAYIQTLGTSREPTFTHWWEAVPSR